jgi:hypothetical protein
VKSKITDRHGRSPSGDRSADTVWLLRAVAFSLFVGVYLAVAPLLDSSKNGASVGETILFIIGLVGYPGALVFFMLGGVHNSTLPDWAIRLLIACVSGAFWATVLMGIDRLRGR